MGYLWKMKATQAWDQHVKSGEATEVQSRFFQPKGWTEELYDMQKDPDNVQNLIDAPVHRQTVAAFRKELRRQQIKFHDTGLVPESEMVKLAAEHSVTIHELARDSNLYNVPELLDAADRALEKDIANLPQLAEGLKSSAVGIRYWAAVGYFLLKDAKSLALHLKDESHEVRAIAAWAQIKSGDKDVGLKCLKNLLEQNSYASLTALNVVDWLGDEGKRLLPTVEAMSPQPKSYEQRMRENLIAKFQFR